MSTELRSSIEAFACIDGSKSCFFPLDGCFVLAKKIVDSILATQIVDWCSNSSVENSEIYLQTNGFTQGLTPIPFRRCTCDIVPSTSHTVKVSTFMMDLEGYEPECNYERWVLTVDDGK